MKRNLVFTIQRSFITTTICTNNNKYLHHFTHYNDYRDQHFRERSALQKRHVLFSVFTRHGAHSTAGKDHYQRGIEFRMKDNLDAALRELKRAKTCFDDDNDPSLALFKAKTLYELGEVTLAVCERKILAERSEIHKDAHFDISVNYTKAYHYYLSALEFYPKQFIEERVICWQRIALLQMKIHRRFEKSVVLIKSGIKELGRSETSPNGWHELYQATNTLLLYQLDHTDAQASSHAILDLVYTQIQLIAKYAQSDTVNYVPAILNAMRIAQILDAPNLLLKFWQTLQTYTNDKQYIYEGNVIMFEAKYQIESKKYCQGWYLGSKSEISGHELPAFITALPPLDTSDLGEAETLAALECVPSIGDKELNSFVCYSSLAQIYSTKRILKAETRNYLLKCVDMAERVGNDYLTAVANLQFGIFHLAWDELSEAEHLLLQAEATLGQEDIDTLFSVYNALIVLYSQLQLDDQVEYYFRLSFELFNNQQGLSDKEWETSLGYALWLYKKQRYEECQQHLIRAVDCITEVFTEIRASVLRRDRVGPFLLLHALISKVTREENIASIFQTTSEKVASTFASYRNAFPQAEAIINQLTSDPDQSDEFLNSVVYPKIFIKHK